MRQATATVIIVDDDPAIREALGFFIRAHGLSVLALESGEELLDSPLPDHPCCIILDLQMPGLNGLEIQRRLVDTGPHPPLIFLTAHADVPTAVVALKRGATDFMQKADFDCNTLMERVKQAIDLDRATLEARRHDARIHQALAALSPRELEVARLAAAGHANKVIGLELGISERTVEVHRGRAMRKLGLRTLAELIRLEHLLQH